MIGVENNCIPVSKYLYLNVNMPPCGCVCETFCEGNMRQSRPGLCSLIGPHEVRSCSICKWKLDPKKVMGTGGVAVTFNKVLELLRPGLASSIRRCYIWQRLFERAPSSLCFIKKKQKKIFCLTHSPFSGLFLLCVIHIHSISTLHPSVLFVP